MSHVALRKSLLGFALAASVGIGGSAGMVSAQTTSPQRDMQEKSQPQAQPRTTQDRDVPSRVTVERSVEVDEGGTDLGWLGLLGLAGLLGLRGRDRHERHIDPTRRSYEEHTRRPDDPTTRRPIV
jgi:MYXO-CTERM domain-containing protein